MSLWLYLAEAAGLLPLKAVSALHSTSDRQEDHGHDIIFNAQFENQYGFCGSVTQDFVSRPPIKQAQVQGSLGRIQWANVYGANSEEVTLFQESAELVFKFPKARSTDFLKELEHIERYLSGGKIGDEVSWERGYATMQALNKSYESIAKGQKIELNISL
jgi:predicted dehydrogenase